MQFEGCFLNANLFTSLVVKIKESENFNSRSKLNLVQSFPRQKRTKFNIHEDKNDLI